MLRSRIFTGILSVPPLCEKNFDILLLIKHFLSKYKRGDVMLEISAETLAILTAYSWNGNIREFESTIKQAAALSCGKLDRKTLYRKLDEYEKKTPV